MNFKQSFLNYLKRFKQFSVGEIVSLVLMFIGLFSGLYFSIAFSVKMSQGLTLFGDANNTSIGKDTIEKEGVTSSDISVLVLFWILTAIVLAIFIYILFIKKPNGKVKVDKDIVDGKTILLKENDGVNDFTNVDTDALENESINEKDSSSNTVIDNSFNTSINQQNSTDNQNKE